MKYILYINIMKYYEEFFIFFFLNDFKWFFLIYNKDEI